MAGALVAADAAPGPGSAALGITATVLGAGIIAASLAAARAGRPPATDR